MFPSAFDKLKAIVGYAGAEMDVQLQKHRGRLDPDGEEGTGTEAEWSCDCNSDKAQYGLVEKVSIP